MNNVMIDIETLGLHPRAHVLSIGAVRFDPETGELGEKLYLVLQGAEQEAVGRVKELSTLKWWMEQSEEARKVFEDNAVNDHHALVQLSKFLKEGDKIWANGSDFDPIVLKTLFNDLGSREPWHYYQPHCYRTMKSVFGSEIDLPETAGTKHNALDDAVEQVNKLKAIFDAVRTRDWNFR